MRQNNFRTLGLLLIFALLGGCAANGGMNNTGKGAAVGAAVGVVVGLITGDNATERRQHAMVGAGIGALAGTAVGAYMDAQERKLKRSLEGSGVEVVRNGDELVLSMPSNITFDVNSSQVKSQFHEVIGAVAEVLADYDKTYIDIAGHTDSRGEWEYNQGLSERRAYTVGDLLTEQGVQAVRIVTQGRGESEPVADNATAGGRAQNRRVNLKLAPITQS